MRAIATASHRRKRFDVLHATRSSQAAMMTLAPGQTSDEGDGGTGNEHPWAEQWLYVVSGSGSATVGRRAVRLRPGSLVLIDKRAPHRIRAGRTRLVTMNIYVPPAYDGRGNPRR